MTMSTIVVFIVNATEKFMVVTYAKRATNASFVLKILGMNIYVSVV